MESQRRFFRLLNRFFMVPLFRLGLGSVMVNPISGYIMVLVMKGRRTGKTRFVPVNYAIEKGRIYCLAGWGRKAHWYLNLEASPELEVILPGRTIHGKAGEVLDPIERLRLSRKVIRSSGIVAILEGVNLAAYSDDRLAAYMKDMVILRIQPDGIGNGPADPGGRAWIMGFVVAPVLCLLALALLLHWIP